MKSLKVWQRMFRFYAVIICFYIYLSVFEIFFNFIYFNLFFFFLRVSQQKLLCLCLKYINALLTYVCVYVYNTYT